MKFRSFAYSVCILAYAISLRVVADILWKPDDISFELKQAHPLLGKGLILELNQRLVSGEY